ncbi:MAG: hypothetical protein ACI35O_08415 [Bacillaceae bacterium]
MVEVGADTTGFDQATKRVESNFNKMGDDLARIAKDSGTSIRGMSREWSYMSNEMKTAYKKASASLIPFKKDLKGVEYDFFKLSQSMKTYSGGTGAFMAEVGALGKRHKKITDEMMKNNELMKASFIQGIGQMMARSTQSEKIAENFDRMGNPLYKVNNGLLKISGSMEKIAKSGNAATVALRMLGPNANMKQLNDMTRMINAGMMRFPAVALIAAAAAAVFYSALFKAAKGPSPAEVLGKQNELMAEYAEQLEARTQEIANAWSIFENIEIKPPSTDTLISNLQEQVVELGKWKDNLAKIAERAGVDFSEFLASMGPQAAGEVSTIASMTEEELDEYVALWKEKMKTSKEQATTELEGLRIETERQVKALQDTLTPLGKALEPMKQSLAKAFQPMVELFGQIMTPIVNMITWFSNLMVKFNEANPILAKVVAGFLLLIPALTLLLAPLAIGVGLVAGLQVAFATLAPVLIPIIAGFASMMGTVLLVAAGIAAVGAALYLLWTKTTWFKDGVLAAWEMIKTGTQMAWDFILNSILMPIWNSIVEFGQQIFGRFQQFWAEHGEAIITIVTVYMTHIRSQIEMVMGIIKGIFEIIWPIISGIVKIAWNLIKLTIGNALDTILGIIGAMMDLLTGDWEGAWESIKGIAEDIWHNIEQFFENVDLYQIGADIINGLLKGLSSMAGAITAKVKEMASLIPDGLASFLGIHSPSRVVAALMEWVPIGAAEGIESQLGTVTKATKSLSEEAIPEVTDTRFQATVAHSMAGANNPTYADDEIKQSSGDVINFQGIFDGAEINIKNPQDIKGLAQELYALTKTKTRRAGFNY